MHAALASKNHAQWEARATAKLTGALNDALGGGGGVVKVRADAVGSAVLDALGGQSDLVQAQARAVVVSAESALRGPSELVGTSGAAAQAATQAALSTQTSAVQQAMSTSLSAQEAKNRPNGGLHEKSRRGALFSWEGQNRVFLTS